MKKTLEDFKKEINSNVVTVRDFNTSLSTMDRSSRQNINKHIVALNNTLDQMDLTDISRTFHPKEAKYTFNSKVHRAFSKTHYMVGYKINHNKVKNIEIISNIFSDHNGLKLEINLKGKT